MIALQPASALHRVRGRHMGLTHDDSQGTRQIAD